MTHTSLSVVSSPDVLIVGAGLWGAVMAERVASLGRSVLVLDKRNHTGGNCYSCVDARTGIEQHLYGAHIFHTANAPVWMYMNRFTTFTGYRHSVLSRHNGRVYPLPISLATINQFFGLDLRPMDVDAFLSDQTGGMSRGNLHNGRRNLEDKAISLIGRPLYEAFIKGYTWKQWQTDPCELGEDIITRLPVRRNYNTDYFNDPWQGMPTHGYATLFDRLLDHPLIEVRLNTDYFQAAHRHELPAVRHTFYTGPLDAFFDHDLGRLGWRSVRFDTRIEPVQDWQGAAVINEADLEVPYTRTIEYKHFHPEREVFHSPVTLISHEYSAAWSAPDHAGGNPAGTPLTDPCYPLDTPENSALRDRYQERASALPRITFGGRLGLYRYMDMDKTVAHALETFEQVKDLIE